MTARDRARAALEAAAELRAAGAFDAARARLIELAGDPDAQALGPQTALGLPRRLHAAFLRLAKAEGDALARAGYQFHLVPPPGRFARWTAVTPDDRRALAAANRRPVPRSLHQIWIGALPVPPAAAAWAAHAARHGYTYRLWREADLTAAGLDGAAAFRAMLARGDLPGAVDAARYAILAAEGGIYLDCDWYPARDDLAFHDLLPLTGLTALPEDIPRLTGAGGLLLANSFLAAPPGHPVFTRLVEVLPQIVADMPEAPAWWSTGPLIFTLLARNGAVALADAHFVAAHLPRGAPMAEVEAIRARAVADDLGPLIAWKSW
jgi:mannosyltransferase OCH1-like enzyme